MAENNFQTVCDREESEDESLDLAESVAPVDPPSKSKSSVLDKIVRLIGGVLENWDG